jgi:hypothetical protein
MHINKLTIKTCKAKLTRYTIKIYVPVLEIYNLINNISWTNAIIKHHQIIYINHLNIMRGGRRGLLYCLDNPTTEPKKYNAVM